VERELIAFHRELRKEGGSEEGGQTRRGSYQCRLEQGKEEGGGA
jgi:hypothetical protein